MLDRPPLVFGRDATPGLLAFQLTADGRRMRLYRRAGDAVVTEEVPFAPFLLLADPALGVALDGVVAEAPLDGPGHFHRLVTFASWPDAVAARDRCREATGQAPGDPAAPYLFLADPAHQYLLMTGRTSFGGLRFDDLVRLALDIEVVTTDGYDFPSAARAGDRIVAVAFADSRGFRHVVRGDRLDEPALLEECSRVIRERDPDVLEGHNVFRFDLEYLEARARRHGVTLGWGRDGSPLRGRPARLQIADRAIAYRRYEVAGRHVVDTWMLAQLYDVGARDLPSFALKDIARHLGLVADDRTYVDAGAIARELREAPERVMAYAVDDAVETLRLSEVFSPPYVAQAQFLPFDYQSTTVRGAAAKIDALLLREYLHRRRAVPAPQPVGAVGGAHVEVPMRGVARPVLHVDVTSLYPSLMLARGIGPRSDTLAVFPELLAHLRDVRVRAKRLAREATDAGERAHLLALQQSFKILINAFYGYLAFTGGHWNDGEAADRVTAEGRGVMAGLLERLAAAGATPVEADTDGVYFVPPRGHRPDDDATLLARIAEDLGDGLQLELDARHAAMLSYKMKTYALLDERGRLTLRGSAFRSRALEPFQRELIREIVRLLLDGRAADVKATVDRWLGDFAAHRVPLRLFARTETLGDTVEAYRAKVAAGERPASAAYELAATAGREWVPGDQVAYYVAGRSARVAVTECAKLAAAWDPARPDENSEYYQAKVLETWERFRPFVERDGLWPAAEDAEPAGPTQLPLF